MNPQTKYVRTDEEWYPSFKHTHPALRDRVPKGTYIKVRLLTWNEDTPEEESGVRVFDADDTCLGIYGSRADCHSVFNQIKDFVTKSQLLAMGFRYE